MKILIVGATSSIAEHTARFFAAEGASLFLVGRDAAKLDRIAKDLSVRGAAAVHVRTFDALDFETHRSIVTDAVSALGELDAALLAHGTLPDQGECERSWEATGRALDANLNSHLYLLTELGNHFAEKRRGNITVISSVAGDRGRQSNYVYGTAKAALSTFLEGLRNRLTPFGVSVTTIKPGFVDTPMTAEVRKGPLFAAPETVGRRIFRAIKNGESVVYTPLFWWPIMFVIRHIPENIFKRLRL